MARILMEPTHMVAIHTERTPMRLHLRQHQATSSMITRSADWFSDRGHVRDASFTQLSNTNAMIPLALLLRVVIPTPSRQQRLRHSF